MRIAVIGTGIAGLGAAYALSRGHEVELFERADYAGGHTNTVAHPLGGRTLPLDTGFIVHNERNYPSLVRLFRELGVATRPSEMSFSVSCGSCELEWSGRRPRAGRLVLEVARFLRAARAHADSEETLDAYVREHGYSRGFRDHFLVPLTAAIWSTAPERALDFPMGYAIRFFDNHGMLGFRRFRWRTVVGGSQEYVGRLLERVGPVHLGLGARALRRTADGVELVGDDGETRRFDRAVVATHAPQALALLADPSDDERRILGAFRTTENETVLHTDERFLPRRRSARAAWNYQLADCGAPSARPTLTYYLNRLQGLEEDAHYCVTLNRGDEIREERVIRRLSYAHPLYSAESIRAQRELPSLNGPRHTAFAGAWQGYGFHEDGLASGLRAAEALR